MFNFSFTTSHAIGNDSDISEKPNLGLFKNSQLKFVRPLLNILSDKTSDANEVFKRMVKLSDSVLL